MDIPVGTSHTESISVAKANLASSLGSGLVDVFATPMLVLLCEKAASNCILPYLQSGQASVGTHVDMSHSAATPEGMTVTATATVTAVDKRSVVFDIVAVDEVGEVGRGKHSRFVIDVEKFTAKAASRKPA